MLYSVHIVTEKYGENNGLLKKKKIYVIFVGMVIVTFSIIKTVTEASGF